MNQEQINNLLNGLAHCTGSENIYKHMFGHLYYTDGIRYLAETVGAYWLLDFIATNQLVVMKRDQRLKQIQFWTITVHPNKSCTIICKVDSDIPPTLEQTIEFTNFPLPEFDIWVAQGERGMTAMLKTEY